MVICFYLSQYKGLAVGALFFGWVGFVGAYLNFTQRAVVLFLCVVSALLNGTFDTLVYITCHGFLTPESLFCGTAIIINRSYIFIRSITHTYFSEYLKSIYSRFSSFSTAIKINSVKQDITEVSTTFCPARWESAFSFCAII